MIRSSFISSAAIALTIAAIVCYSTETSMAAKPAKPSNKDAANLAAKVKPAGAAPDGKKTKVAGNAKPPAAPPAANKPAAAKPATGAKAKVKLAKAKAKTPPRPAVAPIAVPGAPPTDQATAPPFPAFPEAEGFGAYTAGGRGGEVLFVTNLNDAGPGSLRAAVEQAQGPRIVVFRVAGDIKLESRLSVVNPFITIAGQTAPADGVCLVHHGLLVRTNDVVVRHLRIRPGNAAGADFDAVALSGARDTILDHCSITWAPEHALVMGGGCERITVQWCVLAESLRRSTRSKSPRGYGATLNGAGVSFHHNLFAHLMTRAPLVGDGLIDFRNNVIYDWREKAGAAASSALKLNYIGNYLKPSSATRDPAIALTLDNAAATVFAADNLATTSVRTPATAPARIAGGAAVPPATPFAIMPVATDPPAEAYRRVLAGAGATRPARDAADTRIVANVEQGVGWIIESQEEVGGWPSLAPAAAAEDSASTGAVTADTDRDGMTDDWETAHGLWPNDPSDGPADADGDGFTNLEEFLNASDPNDPFLWVCQPSIALASGDDLFFGVTTVTIETRTPNAELHFTVDGGEPTRDSPRYDGPAPLDHGATVKARAWLNDKESLIAERAFTQIALRQPENPPETQPGLEYRYYENYADTPTTGLIALAPVSSGTTTDFTLPESDFDQPRAVVLRGYLAIAQDGVYTFHAEAARGCDLFLGEDALIRGVGSSKSELNSVRVALQAGLHAIMLVHYQSPDNRHITLRYEGPGIARQRIPSAALSRVEQR